MWYIFPLPLTPPLFPFVLSANLSRLLFNEYFERVVDVCYDYVLDSSAVGRDWLDELAAVDVTLRSTYVHGCCLNVLNSGKYNKFKNTRSHSHALRVVLRIKTFVSVVVSVVVKTTALVSTLYDIKCVV